MALLSMEEFEDKGLSESDLRRLLQEEARTILGITARGEPPGLCSPLRDPVLLLRGKESPPPHFV
jgi:hypothetical protein